MDRDESWQVIAEQRLGLADLLERLTDAEWETPSLCAGWRVRDVAAHVAMAPQVPGIGSMIADGGARARPVPPAQPRRGRAPRRDRSTARLVAELRAHAASRRLPVVTNYRNILFDVLVHAQDVAIPLGREVPMPRDAAVAGAARVWAMGWPFWARRRLRGVRLVATDADWSAGAGPEVTGPIGALLLLLTGRCATAAARLTGPGVRLIYPAR